jgi:hypothetical protein
MKDDLTHIAFVLDRSGSMASIETEAREGFNNFLTGQKKEPGQARLTLILFDNEYLVHCLNTDLKEVVPLTKETYVPRAMTALYDAVGLTIDKLGQALDRMPEPERPARVLFVILTDGFENASQRYSLSRIKEMISHQREKYSWQFIFLGANFDAVTAAQSMGVPATHSVTFASTPQGIQQAIGAVCACTGSYRAGDVTFYENLAGAGLWGGSISGSHELDTV